MHLNEYTFFIIKIFRMRFGQKLKNKNKNIFKNIVMNESVP